MRYTITRYYKGNYINPVPFVFTSLEAAVKDLPFTFITGQPNKLQQIGTTDDSLSVYVGNRSSDGFVVLTREDNAFFNFWNATHFLISHVGDDFPSVNEIYDALYTMFGNYLKSVTTQPELF